MTGQLNLNQFALPGMEEHAHAGAASLAEGRGFRYVHEPTDDWGSPSQHALEMYAPQPSQFERTPHALPARMVNVGRLAWLDSSKPHDPDYDPKSPGLYAGEIQGINTARSFQRQGIATTLYNMAMDPNLPTGNDTLPLHSANRTRYGMAWSKSVGGWDPNTDDPKDRPRHPHERDTRVEERRPELPGQQSMFSGRY